MKLKVQRPVKHSDICTISDLYIDGVKVCYSLEDVVREVKGKPVAEWKVQNETAIPCGTYKVIVDYSNHFKKNLPHILNVPGYEGVRIHSGNTAADTEGCIILGLNEASNSVTKSRDAMSIVFPMIQKAFDNKEEITIEIG